MDTTMLPDIYFLGRRRGMSKTDRRINGILFIPSTGFSCKACSGSSGLQPLPEGLYLANNFRDRTDSVMVRDGVGFSVDLADKYDPVLKRMRTLLRIHPDGGAAGTAGCVGILSDVQACRDQLEKLFPSKATVRWLMVDVVSQDETFKVKRPGHTYIWA